MREFVDNIFGLRLGWGEEARFSHWYSAAHFVALFVIFSLMIAACLYFRNKDEPDQKKFLRRIALLMLVLEVGRMVWRTYSRNFYLNLSDKDITLGEVISFALCTQLTWTTILTLRLDRPRLNHIGYNIMFPINLMAGALALFVPTSIFNSYYPFYHFSTMQTLTQHALLLFVPIFLLSTGLYTPRLKNMWICCAAGFVYWVIAWLSELVWHRNFMWVRAFDMIPIAFFENLTFPFTILPLALLFLPYAFICFGLGQRLTKSKAAR